MTSLASPPNRRRRRVVVVIAVVLFGLSWWYWPRGDARFVGKWSAVGLDKRQPVGTFDFGANGRVSFSWRGSDHLTSWRVEDDAIVIAPADPFGQILRWGERVLGLNLPGHFSMRLAIIDTHDGKWHMWPVVLPCEAIELTRIPE